MERRTAEAQYWIVVMGVKAACSSGESLRLAALRAVRVGPKARIREVHSCFLGILLLLLNSSSYLMFRLAGLEVLDL